MLVRHPKVFVVILNWNGIKDTLECLESVFKLDYPNFEVIAVDNGSTDNSVEVIRKTYPPIILIENKENLGYTGGNNIAIRYAVQNGGDYMWLLNNDTVVEPDTLSKLVTTAESRQEIGLVSPVIYLYHNPDRIQFCGSYVDWKGFRILNAKNLQSLREIGTGKAVYLWGTALLVKRNVVQKIGYLNSKYFAYFEDFEYCVRAAKAGYDSVLNTLAKVYHKDSGSTGTRMAPLQVFLRVRNIYFLWISNLKGFDKFRYFKKFMAETISYGASLREENLDKSADACFDGAWSAISGIGGPWNKNVKMPSILRKIFSRHPYFWCRVFKGEFLNVGLEVYKRVRGIR